MRTLPTVPRDGETQSDGQMVSIVGATSWGGRMAKSEPFITVVTCPECGRTGTATWEQDENPVDTDDAGPLLKSVSDGFRSGSESEIYCVDCGVEAITGRTSKQG